MQGDLSKLIERAQFTKGPWFLINDHCVGGPIEPGWEDAGCGVAHCGMRARTKEEAEANARLIAAAPQMFEALKIADAILSNTPEFSTTNSGRIPVTKVSEAREIVRAALLRALSARDQQDGGGDG